MTNEISTEEELQQIIGWLGIWVQLEKWHFNIFSSVSSFWMSQTRLDFLSLLGQTTHRWAESAAQPGRSLSCSVLRIWRCLLGQVEAAKPADELPLFCFFLPEWKELFYLWGFMFHYFIGIDFLATEPSLFQTHEICPHCTLPLEFISYPHSQA